MRVVRGLAQDLRALTPVLNDASNVLCKGNEIGLFNCLFALPGYTCAHMGARMLYVSGGQRSTLCIFLGHSPPCVLGQNLSLNPEVTIWPGCQARGLQGFACLCLPGASTGVTDTWHCIYMGTKDQTG